MSIRVQVTSILNGLATDPLIRQYNVLKYERTATSFQLKLRIEFIDQSILFTNEYLGNAVRKYAFHWQRVNDTWLVRWDNAPYYPLLVSFPHHKHDYRQEIETVTDSADIALAEVLLYIGQQLSPLQP